MMHLSANIRWPWFKTSNHLSKDYYRKVWPITKNKTLEVQISRAGNSLIGVSFDWTVNSDHAGIVIDVSLFRRFLCITFSDNRHWNHEKNRFVDYDNPKEVEKYW